MLINFEAKNIFSFNADPGIYFSMRPGKYRDHQEFVAQGKGNADVKVLRLGLLYGLNSSGKSNLLKSLEIFHDMVIRNNSASLTRFRFEDNPNTSLSLTILTGAGILKYSICFNDEKILHEELLQGKTLQYFKKVYERKEDSFVPTISTEHSTTFKNFLLTTEGRIRPNQLVINKLHDDNLAQFKEELAAQPYCALWDWFKNMLFVYPYSYFQNRNFIGQDMSLFVKQFLHKMGMEVDVEVKKTHLEDNAEKEKYKDLAKNQSQPLIFDANMRYIFRDEKGELYRCEIVFKRRGKEFLLGEESRGVKYLLEILPLLYWCKDIQKQGIYRACFIDELDRRLHPMVTQLFVEEFVSHFQETPYMQIIATTHDPLLIDSVRADCVQVAHKKDDATSYGPYQPRSDATKYKKVDLLLNTK